MNDTKHYYAYVYDDEIKKYIGEVSYYFEEEYREYVLNVIIEYPYRHLGKGKVALELLCKQAKENGLRFLCDDIETNNPAKNLFLDLGFKEVWARENITMLVLFFSQDLHISFIYLNKGRVKSYEKEVRHVFDLSYLYF